MVFWVIAVSLAVVTLVASGSKSVLLTFSAMLFEFTVMEASAVVTLAEIASVSVLVARRAISALAPFYSDLRCADPIGNVANLRLGSP